MNRSFAIALALLLWAPLAWADEITISAPTKPVRPGRTVRLLVSGITDQELISSAAVVTPPSGVSLEDIDVFPGKTWQNIPYIDFSAESPGKYLIEVSVNPWQTRLEDVTRDVEATGIEEAAQLRVVVSVISEKHPSKSGSCVVEVAGTVPPPKPTDPTTPPLVIPPNTKVDRVTYVYEKDQNNVPKPVASALERINRESTGLIVASEFEEDTINGIGVTPAQYKIALDAARSAGLPALIVQSGATVVRVLKSPTTEDEVLKSIVLEARK